MRENEWDDILIDTNNLDEEFKEIPSLIARWNARLAKATEKALLAKHDFSVTKAKVRLRLKEVQRVTGVRKTNDDINAEVMMNGEVGNAFMAYVEAEGRKLRLRGQVDALFAKKDMLQSIGAKIREELRGDPTIRYVKEEQTPVDWSEDL